MPENRYYGRQRRSYTLPAPGYDPDEYHVGSNKRRRVAFAIWAGVAPPIETPPPEVLVTVTPVTTGGNFAQQVNIQYNSGTFMDDYFDPMYLERIEYEIIQISSATGSGTPSNQNMQQTITDDLMTTFRQVSIDETNLANAGTWKVTAFVEQRDGQVDEVEVTFEIPLRPPPPTILLTAVVSQQKDSAIPQNAIVDVNTADLVLPTGVQPTQFKFYAYDPNGDVVTKPPLIIEWTIPDNDPDFLPIRNNTWGGFTVEDLEINGDYVFWVEMTYEDGFGPKTIQASATATVDDITPPVFKVLWTDATGAPVTSAGTWDDTNDCLRCYYKIFSGVDQEPVQAWSGAWYQESNRILSAAGYYLDPMVHLRLAQHSNIHGHPVSPLAAQHYGHKSAIWALTDQGIALDQVHEICIPRIIFDKPRWYSPPQSLASGVWMPPNQDMKPQDPAIASYNATDVTDINTEANGNALFFYKGVKGREPTHSVVADNWILHGEGDQLIPPQEDQVIDHPAGLEIRVTEQGGNTVTHMLPFTVPYTQTLLPPTAGFTYVINSNGFVDVTDDHTPGTGTVNLYEYIITDPDGNVTTVPSFTTHGAPEQNLGSVNFRLTPGDWTIQQTVTDTNGLSDTTTQTVTVASTFPTAQANSKLEYACGSEYALYLDSSASMANGVPIVSRTWAWTSAAPIDNVGAPTSWGTFATDDGTGPFEIGPRSTLNPDTYTWEMTVTNEQGNSDTATGTVTVPNEFPTDGQTYVPELDIAADLTQVARTKLPGAALGLRIPRFRPIEQTAGSHFFNTMTPEENYDLRIDPREFWVKSFSQQPTGINDFELSDSGNDSHDFLEDLPIEVPFYYDPCMPDAHMVVSFEITLVEDSDKTLRGWNPNSGSAENYTRPRCTAGEFVPAPVPGGPHPNIKWQVGLGDTVTTLGTNNPSTDNSNGNKFLPLNASGKQTLHVSFREDRGSFVAGWNRCNIAFVDFYPPEAAGSLLLHSVTVPWYPDKGWLAAMRPVAFRRTGPNQNPGVLIPFQGSATDYDYQGTTGAETIGGRVIIGRDRSINNGLGNIKALAFNRGEFVEYSAKAAPPLVTSFRGDATLSWKCGDTADPNTFQSSFSNQEPYGVILKQVSLTTGNNAGSPVYVELDNFISTSPQSGLIPHLDIQYAFLRNGDGSAGNPTKADILARYNSLDSTSIIPGETNLLQLGGANPDHTQGLDMVFEPAVP